jgi:HK97 gp10 family phage protein
MAEPFLTVSNVRGLKELQEKLEELGTDTANKILKTALTDAANYMRDEIVDNAPEETGFLKEHFNVKMSRKGELAAAAFIGPAGKVDYPRRNAKADKKQGIGKTISVASVARFHEFGTSKMPANPFMRAAFYSAKDTLLEMIINRIKEGIYSATK